MPSSIAVEHRPSYNPHTNGHTNGHTSGHGNKRKHSHINGNGGNDSNHAGPSSSSSSPSSSSQSHSLASTAALHEILMNPLRFDKSVMNPASIKYKPINEDEPPSRTASTAAAAAAADSPTKKQKPSSSASDQQQQQQPMLFAGKIPLGWPGGTKNVGAGLHNRGNTCYMNSVMQSLIHTPPLTHLLLSNDVHLLKGKAGGEIRGFDSVKAMQALARRAAGSSPATGVTSPMEFIKNLKSISKSFSHGRQEDAHEWLRFLLDSMHQSCLVQLSSKAKVSSPLRETTFIHRTFGGKLRSRVTCLSCKHNSDTFETMLDLSLDIRKSNTLRDALDLFTAQDELRGSEKYKCEKCNRLSNANKYYRIASCPPVLTIHLKRFTFTGSKNNKPFIFPTNLKLNKSWLSSGSEDGVGYSLYAVVHHFGSGPHSGHYVAEVKGKNGNWYTMNDDSVSGTSTPGGSPSKSAYILFYVRNQTDALNEVLKHKPTKLAQAPTDGESESDSDEEESESKSRPQNGQNGHHAQQNQPSTSQFSIKRDNNTSSRFTSSNGPKHHVMSPIKASTFHQTGTEEDLGQSVPVSVPEEEESVQSRKMKRKLLKQQQQQLSPQFSSGAGAGGRRLSLGGSNSGFGGSFAKRMKGRKSH
ncbi:unnamed protein product [Sympodiomycopsis kandeliae]